MNRTLRTYLVGSSVVLSVLVFASASSQAFFFSPHQERDIGVEAPTGRGNPAQKSAWPARLTIPAIGVDATVQHTGLTRRGTMAVPESYYDVGWYRYGTAPGQEGSAVIGGHIDTGGGTRAVFSRLSALKTGDDVLILSVGGETLHFIVLAVEEYPADAVPTQRVFNRGGGKYLNLITCSGRWVPHKDMYENRLIVYTTLAPSSQTPH